VAKPRKHGDKWRIRWLDEHGKRQSAVFDDYKRAQTELSRKQVEVEEIKRGVDVAARRRVARERHVGTVRVVVLDVFAEEPSQVVLAEDDQVIDDLPTRGAHPSFGESVLVRQPLPSDRAVERGVANTPYRPAPSASGPLHRGTPVETGTVRAKKSSWSRATRAYGSPA
jgi:hypothetical protein